jgi:hypothetical protein
MINAKHDDRARGLADDPPQGQGMIWFQRAAPAQKDEVALPAELDDGCTGLSLGNRKTNRYLPLCTAHGAEPVKKLLRPGRPLMLGLVDIAGRNQGARFGRPFVAWCRDVQNDQLRFGL